MLGQIHVRAVARDKGSPPVGCPNTFPNKDMALVSVLLHCCLFAVFASYVGYLAWEKLKSTLACTD